MYNILNLAKSKMMLRVLMELSKYIYIHISDNGEASSINEKIH